MEWQRRRRRGGESFVLIVFNEGQLLEKRSMLLGPQYLGELVRGHFRGLDPLALDIPSLVPAEPSLVDINVSQGRLRSGGRAFYDAEGLHVVAVQRWFVESQNCFHSRAIGIPSDFGSC